MYLFSVEKLNQAQQLKGHDNKITEKMQFSFTNTKRTSVRNVIF